MSATEYVKKKLKEKEKANPKAYEAQGKKKPVWKDSKSKKK